MSDPDADLLTTVRAGLPAPLPPRLGVAVSGGGDSVALLHLLHRCLAGTGTRIRLATVDHGLRPEAAAEAAGVAELARSLGLPHDVLKWTGWDGTGNLQDKARQARYDLLTQWAGRCEIPVLALGHTADDQAETVLMRLSRSAGVTGLAAIPACRTEQGVTLIRPLLKVTRQRLRDYLLAQGIDWTDDPSNRDPKFERVRARAVLEQLAPLGIGSGTLADVADNMDRAERALGHCAAQAARQMAQFDSGDVLYPEAAFLALPEEIARRLLLASLRWITGTVYSPRRVPVAKALSSMRAGKGAQLGGCRILLRKGAFRICREFNAVRGVAVPAGDIWDGRWQLVGPARPGQQTRALGRSGLSQVADWRSTERPHACVLATPAVWDGETVIAAPLAGFPNGWQARLLRGEEELQRLFLSH